MATESSVVVALKEVRRLEIDRQRREEESRRLAQEEVANHNHSTVQYGPGMSPFANSNGWDAGASDGGFSRPVHRTSEVIPVQGDGQPYLSPQAFLAQSPPAWEGPDFAAARPQKAKSSWAGVMMTLLLCGGAAAGGLWKQRQDFNAKVIQSEVARQRAEGARNTAVTERSKIEQELKLSITELEGKLAAANAKTNAVSTALASAVRAPAATATPAPLPAQKSRRLRRARGIARAHAAAAARAAAAAKAPAVAAPAATPSPKVAKKKAFTDDPLGGLRL